MCYPKSKGGLGIRSSACFNQAALAKLAWKIVIEPDNWWEKLVKLKYLRSSSFFSATKKASNSATWKGILDAKPLILEGMHWLVGNGSDINFWTYNWCYPFPLFKLVPDNQKPLLALTLTVDLVISNSKWDLNAVQSFVSEDVIKHICSMPIPLEQHPEFLMNSFGASLAMGNSLFNLLRTYKLLMWLLILLISF